jgi:hypothetical protein
MIFLLSKSSFYVYSNNNDVKQRNEDSIWSEIEPSFVGPSV